MSIRLIVAIAASPGKGAELAQIYKDLRAETINEPGCEQFEVFQNVANPDQLVLLERWADQAALDVHARVYSARPPIPPGLRLGRGEREDYEYNRTR